MLKSTTRRPWHTKLTRVYHKVGVLSAGMYNIFLAPVRWWHSYLRMHRGHCGRARPYSFLNEQRTFYEKWKIKFNPEKAEAIVFKDGHKYHSKGVNASRKQVKIVFGSIGTGQTTRHYSGSYFHKNTNCRDPCNLYTNKANSLFSILDKLKGLSKRIKLLCYKQLVRHSGTTHLFTPDGKNCIPLSGSTSEQPLATDASKGHTTTFPTHSYMKMQTSSALTRFRPLAKHRTTCRLHRSPWPTTRRPSNRT